LSPLAFGEDYCLVSGSKIPHLTETELERGEEFISLSIRADSPHPALEVPNFRKLARESSLIHDLGTRISNFLVPFFAFGIDSIEVAKNVADLPFRREVHTDLAFLFLCRQVSKALFYSIQGVLHGKGR